MIEDIGGVTTKLVIQALNISSLRQSVIANNIANAHTPGFTAGRVKFEELIDDKAIYSPSVINDMELSAKLDDEFGKDNYSDLIYTNDNDKVELDIEMINLTENVIRYRTLLSALGARGSILNIAIREGRNP